MFLRFLFFFFFNDTAPPEIYPLSLHDALPISWRSPCMPARWARLQSSSTAMMWNRASSRAKGAGSPLEALFHIRSEEHTSELQSQSNLVCRLLLEKKKQSTQIV